MRWPGNEASARSWPSSRPGEGLADLSIIMRLSTIVMLAVFTAAMVGCGESGQAEEHFNAGVGLQEEGNLQEAIAEYDEAIRLDPDLALAYFNRGKAFRDIGQPQSAIEDLDESIRLGPENYLAYYERGFTYLLQSEAYFTGRGTGLGSGEIGDEGQAKDRLREAMRDVDEAIRLNPEHANAYIARVRIHTLLQMEAEAQRDAAQAIALGYHLDHLREIIAQTKALLDEEGTED